MSRALFLRVVCLAHVAAGSCFADGLPAVPDGFEISVFASEPLVRNPCAMAFDAQGRLFVSQGPQYRKPTPETPGDRISILIDSDGDGVADRTKTFADGLNHVQGMAWRGRDLWVANAPELTIVRDTNGDDEADEYVLVYGGLGNIEHALHGLTHAPDGRVYMTKGNSKGYVDSDSPELYVAPKAFAELWGMELPQGTPEIPDPIVFTRESYRRGYHNPNDDWGTEGGVLRCDRNGRHLEIVSRGMRNPWDMAFDENFNWLLTDQDQDGGDRILSPFPGAHFGWGHHWSAHWTGDNHLPTMPLTGPLFHGSGTGVVYNASSHLSEKYRGVFFAADWLNRSIFVFRPQWDGALMRNMDEPEVLVAAPQGRSLGASSGMVFEPTDIEIGPDGALWILSWGHGYGATIKDGKQTDAGRVYRITARAAASQQLVLPRLVKPTADATVEELVADLRHDRLPAARIDAQDELIRRSRLPSDSGEVVATLTHRLNSIMESGTPGRTHPGASTWLAWTLSRVAPLDPKTGKLFVDRSRSASLVDRVQSLRILGHRSRESSQPLPDVVSDALTDREARVRFAAVQAFRESRDKTRLDELWSLASREADRATFYATWQTLGLLETEATLRSRLTDKRPAVRRAALLALLEAGRLSGDEVADLRLDADRGVAELASRFVELVGTSTAPVIRIETVTPTTAGNKSVLVALTALDIPGAHMRYTLSGSAPTDTNAKTYSEPFMLEPGREIQAALFVGRGRLGPVVKATWEQLSGVTSSLSIDLPPLSAVSVSKIKAASGSKYLAATLQRGGLAYTNRDYSFTGLPESLVGARFIQTANSDGDVGSTGDRFLTFQLDEPAMVYVAHDRRIRPRPDWLDAFTSSRFQLVTRDATYELLGRSFPAGNVVLGGNTADGKPGARSQYVVVVASQPITLEPLAKPTQIAEALERMDSAHPGRGARLFFGAAACSRCHRLGSRGQAFAPNLTKLGKRADAKTIVESILKPNAVIMEGFHTLQVVTSNGKSYAGFIKQESGLSLDLVQADGKLISIPKSDIELRRRQDTSAMPSGLAALLSSQHVADLTAFILAYNEPASGKSDGEEAPQRRRNGRRFCCLQLLFGTQED